MTHLIANLSAVGAACTALCARRSSDHNAAPSPVLTAYLLRILLEKHRLASREHPEQVDEELQSPLNDDLDVSQWVPEEEWERSPLSAQAIEDWAQRLASICLNSANAPWFLTLTMQVEFECLFAVGEHRALQVIASEEQRRVALVDEVVRQVRLCQSSGKQKSDSCIPDLYRALYALLLTHDCLQPEALENRSAQREIAAALESIVPPASLPEFLSLSEQVQRNRLMDMRHLVLGIRTLNVDIGRGGAGMISIRSQALERISNMQATLESEIAFINEVADCYAFTLTSTDELQPAERSRLIDELAHRRQHSLFLQAVAQESAQSAASLKAACDSCASLLNQLSTIVGLRSSVPRSSVFPLFRELGLRMAECQSLDEANQRRQQLLDLLTSYRNPFITSLTPAQISRVNETINRKTIPIAPSEAQFASFVACDEREPDAFNKTSSSMIVMQESKSTEDNESIDDRAQCRRLSPSHPDFMSLALNFQGYCPYTLATMPGVLVPGDPSLGVIRFAGANFALASLEAMQAFVASARTLLERAEQAAYKRPALLQLLHLSPINIAELITPALLERAFKSGALTKSSNKNGKSQRQAAESSFSSLFPPLPAVSVSVGIQTPLHIQDEPDMKQQVDYHWNEWELRRRALKLADLRTKVTRSTQTNQSHFRRENTTQSTLPPISADGRTVQGQATQTRIDSSTNTEQHKVTVMRGLRGVTQQAQQTRYIMPDEKIQSSTNPDLRADQHSVAC